MPIRTPRTSVAIAPRVRSRWATLARANGRSGGLGLLALCAAFALAGCVGGGPELTPLNAPVASDHARFQVTVQVPAGALQRGANDFVVVVQNADRSPGVLTHLTAVMPAHGHTAPAPAITAAGDGRFAVHALEITMPGDWQLTLTVSRTGATDDDTASVLTAVE
jgi:hypothetical protein